MDNPTNQSSESTVTDIDGNVYHTVTIGKQVWMVENLKTTRYRDGTPIPNVTDDDAWRNLTSGAYCDYDNNSNNSISYGRLYNWYAATNSCNIAPIGFHVPSDAEWATLIDYLGGESVAGGPLKEIAHWRSPNTGAINTSGFTALPGGDRFSDATFYGIGVYGGWWSSSRGSAGDAWGRYMYYVVCNVGRRSNAVESCGLSVRCLRD